MSKFVAILVLALLPLGVSAKCQYAWYQVTGTVSDDHGAISGATIAAHWSDSAGTHTVRAKSQRGHYKLELPFQTFSGPGPQPGEDSCTATLSSATITATAYGRASAKRSVPFSDRKATWVVTLRRKDGT